MQYKKYGLTAILLCLVFMTLAQAETTPIVPHENQEITYFHHDATGSVIAKTDHEGNPTFTDYQAYGNPTGETPDVPGGSIGFTGKPAFKDLGLNYLGARWYDPTTGRFMGIDPVDPYLENIHSLNRYAYANNNPYKYVDPDGRDPDLVLALDAATFMSDIAPSLYGVDTSTREGVDIVTGEMQKEGLYEIGGAVVGYGLGRILGKFFSTTGNIFQSGRKFGDRIPKQRGAFGESQPTLKPIHSKETLTSGSNKYSYDYWSKQPTGDIVKSLKPGKEEALRIKPDGRIWNGNTRTTILRERGYDIDSLPREVLRD